MGSKSSKDDTFNQIFFVPIVHTVVDLPDSDAVEVLGYDGKIQFCTLKFKSNPQKLEDIISQFQASGAISNVQHKLHIFYLKLFMGMFSTHFGTVPAKTHAKMFTLHMRKKIYFW